MAKKESRQSERTRGGYHCAECGWQVAKWVGRCAQCQAWGSLVESAPPTAGVTSARQVAVPAVPIGEVPAEASTTWRTGVEEIDRVLGGGVVAGSVVLVAGEPGAGKSTLLLDLASRAAAQGRTVLYVTGEESAAQVRLRAERIGALRPRLMLAAETDLATVLGHVEQVSPDLLVVDSVQTVASAEVDGAAGNVTQVREVAASLITAAKSRDMATVLVGHVTKEGTIAGPRVLEHLVDVVCQFEGDRHSRLRLLRAVKNRYGPTDEVGCFDLNEDGIVGLPDPSGLFVSRHAEPVHGSVITATLEGRRPLVAEVQSLVAPTNASSPRRTTKGLDGSRVTMILAVLDRRGGIPVLGADVYASTVGGVRLTEPGTDLAVALSVAGSMLERAMPDQTLVVGEVGLAGEVRRIPGVGRRLTEAYRLGFRRAVIPAGTTDSVPGGMLAVEVGTVQDAVRAAFADSPLTAPEAPRRPGPR